MLYTYVRTEHEIIGVCENIIANYIVSKANNSQCFSNIADETSDIGDAGKQLSQGVRFPVSSLCRIERI